MSVSPSSSSSSKLKRVQYSNNSIGYGGFVQLLLLLAQLCILPPTVVVAQFASGGAAGGFFLGSPDGENEVLPDSSVIPPPEEQQPVSAAPNSDTPRDKSSPPPSSSGSQEEDMSIVILKVFIVLLVGIASLVSLVVFTYILALVSDRLCCCFPWYRPILAAHGPHIYDQSALARRAGLWGLTLAERAILLPEVFSKTTYTYSKSSATKKQTVNTNSSHTTTAIDSTSVTLPNQVDVGEDTKAVVVVGRECVDNDTDKETGGDVELKTIAATFAAEASTGCNNSSSPGGIEAPKDITTETISKSASEEASMPGETNDDSNDSSLDKKEKDDSIQGKAASSALEEEDLSSVDVQTPVESVEPDEVSAVVKSEDGSMSLPLNCDTKEEPCIVSNKESSDATIQDKGPIVGNENEPTENSESETCVQEAKKEASHDTDIIAHCDPTAATDGPDIAIADEKVGNDLGTNADRDEEEDLDDADHERICCICLNEYLVGSQVLTGTACNHLFHKDCSMQWLQKHDHCPYCRKEMFSPAEFRQVAIQVLDERRIMELSTWGITIDVEENRAQDSGGGETDTASDGNYLGSLER